MHRILYIFLLTFLIACDATAQAWTPARGGYYVKLSQGRASAAEQFTATGDPAPYMPEVTGKAFQDRSFYLYGEYGLTDRLALIALLPYKQVMVETPMGLHEIRDTGSLMLGLRTDLRPGLGLRNTRHAAALNTLLTLPTGYARNLSPSVGTGQADLQASLAYGASLHPLPLYAQASLGYRYRSNLYALSQSTDCTANTTSSPCLADLKPDYDNEWLFHAESGASLGRWALVQGLFQGTWSNQAPDTNFDPNNPLPTRQRFVKAGLGLTLYPIPQVGLSVQHFNTLTGRNTIDANDWFFGLEIKR
jgi:hypothetical protein